MSLMGLKEMMKQVVSETLVVMMLYLCPAVQAQEASSLKIPAGMRTTIIGTIVKRDADSFVMYVMADDGNVTVQLTSKTRVVEKKSNPFRSAKNYGTTQLLLGLTAKVEGRGAGNGNLIAYTIGLKNDALVTARRNDSRVTPVEGRVISSQSENSTDAKNESPEAPKSPPQDRALPKIVITSPPLTRGQGVKPAAGQILKQSGSSLTVTGQATDESGVREVTVRDVAARLDERGNFSAEVPLQAGDNPITVTATDNYGNRATENFTVRYEPPPVTGRYFALVIGNNRYPNLPTERQLKTAVNDAQEVAALLRTEYGFQTKLLTDGKRAQIINALNEYRRSLKPDDNLLIYYAGHGHFDSDTGKAYWIPTDAEMSSPANWIIADDVTSTIKAIPSRHILIVSDSCYSGTLTRATDFLLSTPAERERYLEKMRGGTSRWLMASGGNEPVADGGGSGHSVFARAVLDGLRGMSERVFTADELFHQYIKERVAGKSDQTPEYNPLRNSGHEAGDFVFVRVK